MSSEALHRRSYENESNNWVPACRSFSEGRYFDDLKTNYQKSQIVQSNNYYAFGLQTKDSWTRIDSKPNQYLYNAGSELNEATSNYEMMFRSYDPAIGRMSGVDPMVNSFASLTPYNYSFNDPVYWNDPSGAIADNSSPNSNSRKEEDEDCSCGKPTEPALDMYGTWSERADAYFDALNGVYNPIAENMYYGGGVNSFGDGYISGIYYGSARLQQQYNVTEVWKYYYTNGDRKRPIDSQFIRYKFTPKGRDTKQTSRHPGDTGSSISISGNLTLGGGVSFEVGFAWDDDGDYTGFWSIGPSLGYDASFGVLAKAYYPYDMNDGFDVTDLKGYGAAYNLGIFSADGTVGGNFVHHDDWFNPFTDMGETYYEVGAGASFGSPFGVTYEYTYTGTFLTFS